MCNAACGRMDFARSKNPARTLYSSSVLFSDESNGSRLAAVNCPNFFGLSGCCRLYLRRSSTLRKLSQRPMLSRDLKYVKVTGPKISSHSLSLNGLLPRTAVSINTRDDPAVKTCSRMRACVSVLKIDACDPRTCIVRYTAVTRCSAVKPTWEVIAPLGSRLVLPVSTSRKRPHNDSIRWSKISFMPGVRLSCSLWRKYEHQLMKITCITSKLKSPPNTRPGTFSKDCGQRSGNRHLLNACTPLRSSDDSASLCRLFLFFSLVPASTIDCNRCISDHRFACRVPRRKVLRPFLGPLQIPQVLSERLPKNLYLYIR